MVVFTIGASIAPPATMVGMTKRFLVLALLWAAAGCAPTVWNKPGATQQDYNVDSYACERDARQSGYFGGGFAGAVNMKEFFGRCMVSKGWHAEQEDSTKYTTFAPNDPAFNPPPGKPEYAPGTIRCRVDALTWYATTADQCRGTIEPM